MGATCSRSGPSAHSVRTMVCSSRRARFASISCPQNARSSAARPSARAPGAGRAARATRVRAAGRSAPRRGSSEWSSSSASSQRSRSADAAESARIVTEPPGDCHARAVSTRPSTASDLREQSVAERARRVARGSRRECERVRASRRDRELEAHRSARACCGVARSPSSAARSSTSSASASLADRAEHVAPGAARVRGGAPAAFALEDAHRFAIRIVRRPDLALEREPVGEGCERVAAVGRLPVDRERLARERDGRARGLRRVRRSSTGGSASRRDRPWAGLTPEEPVGDGRDARSRAPNRGARGDRGARTCARARLSASSVVSSSAIALRTFVRARLRRVLPAPRGARSTSTAERACTDRRCHAFAAMRRAHDFLRARDLADVGECVAQQHRVPRFGGGDALATRRGTARTARRPGSAGRQRRSARRAVAYTSTRSAGWNGLVLERGLQELDRAGVVVRPSRTAASATRARKRGVPSAAASASARTSSQRALGPVRRRRAGRPARDPRVAARGRRSGRAPSRSRGSRPRRRASPRASGAP